MSTPGGDVDEDKVLTPEQFALAAAWLSGFNAAAEMDGYWPSEGGEALAPAAAAEYARKVAP